MKTGHASSRITGTPGMRGWRPPPSVRSCAIRHGIALGPPMPGGSSKKPNRLRNPSRVTSRPGRGNGGGQPLFTSDPGGDADTLREIQSRGPASRSGTTFNLNLGGHNGDHLAVFHRGSTLDFGDILQKLENLVHDSAPFLDVGQLPTPELHHQLHLVLVG